MSPSTKFIKRLIHFHDENEYNVLLFFHTRKNFLYVFVILLHYIYFS